jgi:hypothetical protein
VKKKDLLFYCTLALVSIAFGVWLRMRMSVPFTGFEGEYQCGELGLPEKDYNVLRFTPNGSDQILVDSMKKTSETQTVGRLRPQSLSLGRLELDSSLVHSPGLTLNPLAEHIIEGQGRTISIIGRQEGKELYRHKCTK